MANHRPQSAAGFTLIELLVVIVIIALLIGILLPLLGAGRQASRVALCGSNQKQLMTAWETVMIDRDGDIPLTINTSSVQPQWWQLLRQRIESARYASGSSQPLIYPCPEVAATIDGVGYMTVFGYSANTRWTPGSPANPGNERQQWANIANPSRYPWLADGYVTTPHLIVRGFVGYKDYESDNAWGVGFLHPDDTAIAAFADGHAESVSRDQVAEVENGEPVFFLNR
ncbi:MAG: prepilin-type N-terminal cleavage/methylation domain-containing protein [Planctomycetota bacterium]